jgi:hypothetical protein
MNFIFSKLPLDIIKYEILPYDKHFIIRKGEIVAIIPKDDMRYVLLQSICLVKKTTYIIAVVNNHKRFEYTFCKNLYDPIERKKRQVEDDLLEVTMYCQENGYIEYHIFISRLKPNSLITYPSKKKIFIPNFCGYSWQYQDWDFICY